MIAGAMIARAMRPSPQQTQDSINVDLTLAQRRGRWNNVKPTLI